MPDCWVAPLDVPLVHVAGYDFPAAAFGVVQPAVTTICLDDARAHFGGEDEETVVQDARLVDLADDRENLDHFGARVERDAVTAISTRLADERLHRVLGEFVEDAQHRVQIAGASEDASAWRSRDVGRARSCEPRQRHGHAGGVFVPPRHAVHR